MRINLSVADVGRLRSTVWSRVFVVTLVLWTALSMVPEVARASSAAISLSASNGTVTQTITVTGSGFGNNSLSVYWDSTSTTPLSTVWANGTFSAKIKVPQTTGGTHVVIARDAGGNQAQTSFAVTPSLLLQFTSGLQGSSNTANTYGYASGESVSFYWQSTAGPVLGTVSSTTKGTATLSFKVPSIAAGTYTVYAIGPISGQSSGQFTVTPGFTFSSSTGGPGSTILASGTAFTANQTVSIYWNCTSPPCGGAPLASVTTDGNGSFSNLPVTLPSPVAAGSYSVGAQDSASPPLFVASGVTIQPPSSSASPTSGSAGTVLKISGAGFQGGEVVGVYWNCSAAPCTGSSLGSMTASSTGAVSSSVIVPSSTNGTYPVALQGSISGLYASSTFTIKPVLTLSPARGNAGTVISVAGSGYVPNESVSTYWNCTAAPCSGSPLAVTTADSGGNLNNVTITIPSAAVGSYVIAGQGAASINPSFASATFAETNLSITLSPATGSVGQPIAVSGTGFGNSSLNLYWDSTSNTALKTIWANGTFNTTITLPAGTTGSHLVIAKDGVGNQAQAVLTVTPSASLQAASGSPGAADSLTLNGYGPSETVNVYWNCSSPCTGTPTWTATTNSLGTAKIPLTIPAAPSGTYAVTAVGASSDDQISTQLTVVPSIAVTPSSGGPGSTVSVSGTGFNPGQAVSLYWNCSAVPCNGPVLASSAPTDSNGNFVGLSITLPAAANSGAYPIGAQDGASNSAFAYKLFTVVPPSISLTPNAGPAGSTSMVAGSGFLAGEAVNIYWNCSSVPCSNGSLGALTASSTGTISGSVTIPTGETTGAYSIAAQGMSSVLFATTTFTAKAVLSLSPTTGGSGTSVTAKGTGYNPGENVSIYWNCTTSCSSAPLISVQADSSGAFATTITIPASIYATYPVTGIGDGGNSAGAIFKVVPAVNIAQVGGPPVNLYGVVGVQPGQAATVSGVSFAAKEVIDVYWCRGSTCSLLVTSTADASGAFSGSVTVPSNIPNAGYTVKAVGETSLQSATTTTTILPIATITPNSGPAGATVTIAGQGFGVNHWVQIVWNCPIGISCSGQGTIWIDTNSDANGSFQYTATIPPNSVVTGTPVPGTYWVRVKDHTFPFQTETWTTYTVQ